MHVEINAQFELDVDGDKTIPLATLGEFLTEQNIPARLLEATFERLDEQLVDAFCGEKHAHGNGDERFQRAATKIRTAVTTAGDHEFSLTYVNDTAAD